MAIRDQLTVLPPAESPDSGNLRILDEWLRLEGCVSPVSAPLSIPARGCTPRLPQLGGPRGEDYDLPGEVFEVLCETVSAMVDLDRPDPPS